MGMVEEASVSIPDLWSFHFVHAEVLRMGGKVQEALEYLQLLGLPSQEHERSHLDHHMHTGYCLALMGKHAEGRLLLERALAMARLLNDLRSQVEVKVRIAMLEFLSNHLDRAEDIYQQIIEESYNSIGWYLHCMGLSGRGKILLHKKKYEDAIAYLERALAIAQQEEALLLAAGCQSEIALCALALGDSGTDLKLLRESERITWGLGAIHVYSVVLGDLGNVYLANGDYWTAIPYYQRALNLALQINDPAKIDNWSHNIRLAYGKFRTSLRVSN